MENIEYIRSKLPQTELLAGLAEEATELAQAALKLRRVMDGTNHTPKTFNEAFADIAEEIGDVTLCLRTLGYEHNEHIEAAMQAKLIRWRNRLENNHVDDDFQVRRLGRWIIHSNGKRDHATNWAECSHCHTAGSPGWKSCPVCDTKMDGGAGNEDD